MHASVQKEPASNFQLIENGHLFQFETDGIRLKSTDIELHTTFVNSSNSMPLIEQSGSAAKPCGIFSKVDYQQIWPGINLTYDTVDNGILRNTWDVAAGANVNDIRLQYNANLDIDSTGQLRVHYKKGEMRESAPFAWQIINGSVHSVEVAFKLLESKRVGFEVGSYNKNYPLKLDPTLEWNTFAGDGSTDPRQSYSESSAAMAVDETNNTYLAINKTFSLVGTDPTYSEQVIKLDSQGKQIWKTKVNAAVTLISV